MPALEMAAAGHRDHNLLQYFTHQSLAPHLQEAALPFSVLAQRVADADVTSEAQRDNVMHLLLAAQKTMTKCCIQMAPDSGEALPNPKGANP